MYDMTDKGRAGVGREEWKMADTQALTECFRDTLRQKKEDRELAERTLAAG